MQSETRISHETLQQFVKEILIRFGMPPQDAQIEAEVLLWANLRGIDSHGVLQIPSYLKELDEGYMNPRPDIRVINETPATMVIDADLAFGAVVTVFTMNKVIEKTRDTGICWATIRNTSHQGAMGYYTLMAAEKGMAGIIFTCTPPAMAPFGAKAAGVDNSPLSIGVPAGRYGHVILDMATSVSALGKIKLARDKGLPIPEGWALDEEGKPTTDPNAASILLPVGGAKGSGLALMFECLSSIMIDNPLLEPVLDGTKKSEGHQTQNSVAVAIDIGKFTDVNSYKEHIDNLLDGLKALPRADGFSEILYPGERGKRTHEDRSRNGIPLPEGTIRRLRDIAERFGLSFPQGM
jgi:LDH2 family malate/lactate/ureidoglycolate dehydrogenase